MKKISLVFVAFLVVLAASADNKIKYYFNKPVDNSISTGANAVYLNNCAADTLAAYLGRAKYSIDICVYSFEKTISFSTTVLDTVFTPKVAAAIDSAYAHGVKVRFIYEASNTNSGLTLLDTNIHTLGSPQGPNYNIMHDKFMVIDAHSADHNDPIVWTGCMNWYYQQYNWDYNNVVVLQDSALAQAYTAEFNMMWGDTGIAPNLATSKFGLYKTDLGLHNFTIDGRHIELYFSPSDQTDNHIQSTIASANKDLYFGMYTFTEHNDADLIMAKFNSGLNVYGINDSWSSSYYPTGIFTTGLGSHFIVYNETTYSLFHNKFVIIDPSDTCSDPMVLTGSHNWTATANSKNDENTLIIHDPMAANLYLQYFKACFNGMGGTMALPANNCDPLGAIQLPNSFANSLQVFPTPTVGPLTIAYTLSVPGVVAIEICNLTGQKVADVSPVGVQDAGTHSLNFALKASGIYYIRMVSDGSVLLKKIVVID